MIARYLTTVLFLAAFIANTLAQEVVDDWKYTLRKPNDKWNEIEFKDDHWKTGSGGLGTIGTPGSRIGTIWSTKNVWLRKEFQLKQLPAKPAILVHHDEDCEIFINGRPTISLNGFLNQYKVIELSDQQASALKVGKNLLAVHCRQTGGGQTIDVHVVDATQVPTLPTPKRDTRPFESELMTQWGAEVTAGNAWTQYPRPQMQRKEWKNLNGHWDYAISPVAQREVPTKWDGKILVPFCLESKLGGVKRLLEGTEALWYHRTVELPKMDGKHLLHFEAVDYRCEVFVNGKSVGTHQGGNTPFSFDISSAAIVGKNELVVRVEDETEKFQLRGKQVLNAHGIWYTQVSGIWQTVWMESVPQTYIEKIKLATRADSGEVDVKIATQGTSAAKFEVFVNDGATKITQGLSKSADQLLTIAIPKDKLKLWSPDSPHLYDLEIRLLDASGKVVDQVDSYVGVRTVGKVKDADGHWRFTLNGKTIFHWGPLDQGWWPDGLLTPPSDEAMTFDIAWLKSSGFNMIRKHIKVEPRRYYYHCDRLGMMVWQDQVSGGPNPEWTRLVPDPKDAEWPDEHHSQFMLELERMIDGLENHPSIVCWVPFNEAWGQHKTVEVGQWTVKRDPSRHVNIASGGNFWPVGDIVDEHAYPHPSFPFELDKGRFDGFIKVMGEFGGHGFPVAGHLWDNDRDNWGYGGLPKDEAEYKERYQTSIDKLVELKKQGIAAGIYTQTTDVEIEVNGLMTYDRKVIKIPANELKQIHSALTE
jgi:Glycosyl hydrolases family 2, sugar binding domain/Glycosyl hydrolases family 2/Glycosyl hydrolases family 2, TIM barrel domain